MPFIRGRYHINPIAGEALEAARAAEAALSEIEEDAHGASDESEGGPSGAEGGDDEGEFGGGNSRHGDRAIHRVEIEAAEMVPAHSGRAQRGFVAHVHREVAEPPSPASGLNGAFSSVAPREPRRSGEYPSSAYAPRPETHVFADHRDLLNFLRDQFGKDCKR